MKNAQGFTLIELLVALSIVGIVTAFSLPQFREYRARAYDTRSMSDLRNVAVAEESYFIDTESYLTCSDRSCEALPGISRLSQGVTLSIAATPTGFTGTATHEKGSGRVVRWNSSEGGVQ